MSISRYQEGSNPIQSQGRGIGYGTNDGKMLTVVACRERSSSRVRETMVIMIVVEVVVVDMVMMMMVLMMMLMLVLVLVLVLISPVLLHLLHDSIQQIIKKLVGILMHGASKELVEFP